MMSTPRQDHLARLTTATGLYEHALSTAPSVEHGMCVDDVTRALVVTCRVAQPTHETETMSRTYLAFLLQAQDSHGRMHNRSDSTGRWLDRPSSGDHWGRALWAFGTAVTRSPDTAVVTGAQLGASRALRTQSTRPQAMAYAALGAALLLKASPDDLAARRLLHEARLTLPRSSTATAWGYDLPTGTNAVLAEAMITIGQALHDDQLRHEGLLLLGWLQDEQTVDGCLSPTPVKVGAPEDPRLACGRQSIEIAALAEAAHSAFGATGNSRWAELVTRCQAWFDGDNDCHLPMRDPATGGAGEDFESGSVGQRQCAESTLAWLATDQLTQELAGGTSP
jgi:hypothetical protein